MTPKFFLFTNNIEPNPDSVYTDFTLPTASWYSVKACVFTPVYWDLSNSTYNFNAEPVTYTYSGTDPSTTIYGWGVWDGISAYYGGALFPTPVTLQSTLDTYTTPSLAFIFSTLPPGQL